MSPESLSRWSQLKGISVIGAGDFTHPEWLRELKEKLEPAGNGLFALKKAFHSSDVPVSCKAEVSFLLSVEISCIYSKAGKIRKVHCLILSPDFGSVEKISTALSKVGNLGSDGRPILRLDASQLLKIVLETCPESMLIPAHAWTPHFSVFGAASGFDSLEECFEELTPYVHAIETGLSSDPPMNWRLSSLDRITLISNSDAHSPSKIGREANIFDCERSYKAMMNALRTREEFVGTIEFFPQEGKYHLDGHRGCGVSLSPKETMRHNYLCPVCRKKVTVGVMHRVERLADRDEGYKRIGSPDFYSLVPLPEIITQVLKVGVNSKAVEKEYFSMLGKLGNEFHILMDHTVGEIEKASSPKMAEAISRVREGEIHIEPGYDGEYGKIKIFEKHQKKR